jgi:quercetin dioxygenase-like cupin family protein
MNRRAIIALSGTALACWASAAAGQNAPPTYQADPSVYKIIFEDANFRVIAATWKAGQTDKPHSHPVPSVVYSVTDCTLKLTTPDGKVTNISPKAGSSTAVPVTASHTAENTGATECRTVFVEHK